ncbi:NAD(P)/FAD-dependent oxidoreductase [Streptomyces hirsutus]|uniref:NAD(P)/FAD-dependent oxidoreductase n=1 Tax=Streptomyces hirsutus TaxID=35620 RepID=UPI0033A39DBB
MMYAGAAPQRVVVVGGGIGGGRTCAALRSAGFDGEIVLIGDELHEPYDRPPLTKAFLHGDVDLDLGLGLAELEVSFARDERATGLDLAHRRVTTDRSSHDYDFLVIATGACPVTLPGDGPQVTLRTREDAERLRESLVPGARLVVIGAGWIGAEVSTAALTRGCRVTCVELGAAPLEGPLGPEVGRRLLPWWQDVDLRTSTRVREVSAEGVVLADGELIPADAVVTGVGVRADTDWLARAGLAVEAGGVAVDADRRTSDPHVFAVGDVAARWSDLLGRRVHPGHWDEAVNGALAAAGSIVGTPKSADDVPYFWSDQFGRKLQYVGQRHPGDRVFLREHDDPERWGAAWIDAEGRLSAHLSVGFPRSMVQARVAIAERRIIDLSRVGSLTESF